MLLIIKFHKFSVDIYTFLNITILLERLLNYEFEVISLLFIFCYCLLDYVFFNYNRVATIIGFSKKRVYLKFDNFFAIAFCITLRSTSCLKITK